MSTNLKIRVINNITEETCFFCKLCGFPLHSHEDFKYHKEFSCCTECYLTFAESRRKEWKDGWRPEQTVLEEYIYNRKLSKIAGSKNEL